MSETPGATIDEANGVVLASDRGPVTFTAGRPVRRSGSVTGLLDRAMREIAWPGTREPARGLVDESARRSGRLATWLAASVAEEDRTGDFDGLGLGYTFRPVMCEPAEYRSYYDDVGVRMLWYAHHGLWSLMDGDTEAPSVAAFDAYQAVNERFAAAVANRSHPRDLVVFNDYQLSTAPGFLRRHRPGQPIGLFTHTPFATPAMLARLSERVTTTLIDGMLGADLLGFQRPEWAARFLACCRAAGAEVDHGSATVRHGGRRVFVRCHPVPADHALVRDLLDGDEAREWTRRLAEVSGGRQLIVRVDRLDPAKNLLCGFLAYRMLLDRNPAFRGRVCFVACMVPSRSGVREYERYRADVLAAAADIECAYPGSLVLYEGENRARASAALGAYDVLLVNPLLDGMNLVAQEGPVLNPSGAVVLSSGAGSYDLLGAGAIRIDDPADVTETAAAVETALTMPRQERERRGRVMRGIVLRTDSADWLRCLLDDLAAIRDQGVPVTPAPET